MKKFVYLLTVLAFFFSCENKSSNDASAESGIANDGSGASSLNEDYFTNQKWIITSAFGSAKYSGDREGESFENEPMLEPCGLDDYLVFFDDNTILMYEGGDICIDRFGRKVAEEKGSIIERSEWRLITDGSQKMLFLSMINKDTFLIDQTKPSSFKISKRKPIYDRDNFDDYKVVGEGLMTLNFSKKID